MLGVIACTLITECKRPTLLSKETSPYLYKEGETFDELDKWISLGQRTITAYSSYESCDYKVENGCLAADGRLISEGVVACPREHKLGTKFIINGEEYICRDRTNKRYDGRFDLFFGYGKENYLRAKEFGIQRLEVEIIK